MTLTLDLYMRCISGRGSYVQVRYLHFTGEIISAQREQTTSLSSNKYLLSALYMQHNLKSFAFQDVCCMCATYIHMHTHANTCTHTTHICTHANTSHMHIQHTAMLACTHVLKCTQNIHAHT